MEMLAIPEMDRMIDAYRASEDKEEMKQLAHDMTQLHHDYASFVPGYYEPFYRVGHWRWIRYPKDFNVKHLRAAASSMCIGSTPSLKSERLRRVKTAKAWVSKSTFMTSTSKP